MREAVRAAVAGGLPTVAECGGFLYLNRLLSDGEGRDWPMAGALPGRADKPQSRRGWDCAFHTPTLYAGFPHFHFWAAPAAARNFVAAARRYVQEAAL